MSAREAYVGQAVDRIEDLRFLTGRGRFVDSGRPEKMGRLQRDEHRDEVRRERRTDAEEAARRERRHDVGRGARVALGHTVGRGANASVIVLTR